MADWLYFERLSQVRRPRWMEESFPTEQVESFVQLCRGTSIPVASGEHIYGRWEAAQRYLSAGALNVIQCDPEWCGGISELVKICTVASLHDVQVISHGHSLHATLHVVASQPPVTCPLVEYLILKNGVLPPFRNAPAEARRCANRAPRSPRFRHRTRPVESREADLGPLELTFRRLRSSVQKQDDFVFAPCHRVAAHVPVAPALEGFL
jgi:hypothetical protein